MKKSTLYLVLLMLSILIAKLFDKILIVQAAADNISKMVSSTIKEISHNDIHEIQPVRDFTVTGNKANLNVSVGQDTLIGSTDFNLNPVGN